MRDTTGGTRPNFCTNYIYDIHPVFISLLFGSPQDHRILVYLNKASTSQSHHARYL